MKSGLYNERLIITLSIIIHMLFSYKGFNDWQSLFGTIKSKTKQYDSTLIYRSKGKPGCAALVEFVALITIAPSPA
ncbi:hypothetical protein CMK12_10550 [Candidatus Poribacteria bacterium]|nr:hypothetical protein [Candidatus Poribacteria bacterium]